MSNPRTGEALLRVQGIVKDYRQGKTTLRVLKGVTLDIQEGEMLVVAGPSGAGKSTLLHIMGLLDRPTSGEVAFEGRVVSKRSSYEQSRLRNSLFGFVFQFFHLLPDLTALENVLMPAMVRWGTLTWPKHRKEARDNATQLMDRVGLAKRVRHRPSQLSGGERQRVALCRALINRPRVLLLDEPTGNLDSRTGKEILDLVHEMNAAEKQTVVMVTHDENAARSAGRVVRIRDGELLKGK
jgi:lipoprotein-releasing system ATP-binding protein